MLLVPLTILLVICDQTLSSECNGFVDVFDFKEYMAENATAPIYAFFSGGSTEETTIQDNEIAYTRYKLVPNVLNDVSKRDLSTTVLGVTMPFPVGIAPMTGMMLADPEGENSTAKGAAAAGTLMILSTLSSVSMEQVAASAPDGTRWFQLFVQKDKEVTKSLIKRAEQAGYKALVITVDVPVPGISWENQYASFVFPKDLPLGNFNFTDTNGMDKLTYARKLIDSSLTWDGIAELKSLTTLPIIIKGILSPVSAKKAKEAGAAGIIVSNHGGRALDGVPATIDVLKDVVDAVGSDYPVLLDGGIRTGTDVLKALAMGAKAVFIGKPAAWAMHYDGSNGLQCVLNILKTEFDNAMALSGFADVKSISPTVVVKESHFEM